MKRLFLILALLVGASFPAYAQSVQLCYTINGSSCLPGVQASQSVKISIAAATTTELVALNTSRSIYVTSFDVMAAGNGNFTLVYGSGTNCGTGTTALTGAYPLIAQAGISKGNGMGAVLVVPKGKALCATTSSSVLFAGSVSYAQF